jgi:hypothetical protein
MGRGTTSRTAFYPSTPYTDANPLAWDMQRWSSTLPFGGFGFQVTSGVSQSLAVQSLTPLVWDTVFQDRESWMTAQVNPFSAFIVPPGGAGVYAISLSHRLTNPVNGVDSVMYNGYGTTLVNQAGIGSTTGSFFTMGSLYLGTNETVDFQGTLRGVALNSSAGSFTGQIDINSAGNPTFTNILGPSGFGINGVGGVGTTVNHATLTMSMSNVSPATYGYSMPDLFTFYVRSSATVTAGTQIAVADPTFRFQRTQRAPGQVLVVLQVNNLAVSVDDITDGTYGETSTLQWLNDGDVISCAIQNNSAYPLTLAADNAPSAATAESPLFSAVRLALP